LDAQKKPIKTFLLKEIIKDATILTRVEKNQLKGSYPKKPPGRLNDARGAKHPKAMIDGRTNNTDSLQTHCILSV
jgi:hypothetical protein